MITRLGSYSQIKGSIIKQPCIVATLGNIDLSGATNIIDGINLQLNDRVFVNNQILSQYNGIYDVVSVGTGSNGVWERSLDFSISEDIYAGINIYIITGNTYTDSYFILETTGTTILDITPLTFSNKKMISVSNIDNNQVLYYFSNNITGSTNFTFDQNLGNLNLGDITGDTIRILFRWNWC